MSVQINESFKSFSSISLAELNLLNFDDRQDTKFVFHQNLLPELLESLTSLYKTLDVKGLRCFQYDTLYFDTPELLLYDDHHRGKIKRHKFRFRKYVESTVSFFEIKTRNNKHRNQKIRIGTRDIFTELTPELKSIISSNTLIDPELLQPSLAVSLSRITLVHVDNSEKVTLDFNIRFTLNGDTREMKDLVIAEVKQERYNPKSAFFKIQHGLRIYPSTVSKYCLGIALLNQDSVKVNRFKEGIRKLEKISG